MIKKIALTLITLILISLASSAQQPTEPERLQPKVMASLSTVDECTHPNDSIAFYAIHNGDSLIGYLMEPKDDFWSTLTLSFILKDKDKKALSGITLTELREAEQQMVDILNAYVDSAQEVHRCFTPPRFYDHGRQYLFYTDSEGHRCLYVTFYDFHHEPEYLRRILLVCDGDDGFWQADFDLTAQKLKWFSVNGPTIYPVPGRSKEKRGLMRESKFYSWFYPGKTELIDEKELPEAAKAFCDQRLTKNLSRRDDGVYFYDILNGPTAYFDSTGHFLALISGRTNPEMDLEKYISDMITSYGTMKGLIQEDIKKHGGSDDWMAFRVERITDKWLICVAAGCSNGKGFNAYYTFDDQGQLLGIDRPL